MHVQVHTIFEHEISYLHQVISHDPAHPGTTYAPTRVMATFKELSRVDVSQHKLAMLITKTFRKFKFEKVPRPHNEEITSVELENRKGATLEELKFKIKMELDDEAIYDLTVRFINDMSVYSTEYDEQVKNTILSDSGALYHFGTWLLGEKIAPFFRSLHEI